MPELPDVERFRRYLDETSRGHTVRHIDILEPKMLDGIRTGELRRHVEGQTVRGARRMGKYLLAEMDDGYLVLHFGMSGWLQCTARDQPPPPHTRVLLDLDDRHLAYVVPRKIGRVGYVRRMEELREAKDLGIDALSAELDFATFKRLAAGKGTLKCWLMDQSAIAGVGNEYSDEILFHAHLSPHRRTADLSDAELKRLYRTLRNVLETAAAADADKLPDHWLLSHRKSGAPCPRCQGVVKRESLCGRSAYWCPACQH